MKHAKYAPRLSDLAYESILQALFDDRVPMGDKISQGQLVELTGVPVGPVRDALKVLEADGLVIVHPRSGIELIKPSTELVRSTIQFRSIIEKPAARRFATSASEETLADLRQMHEKLAAELENMDGRTNTFDLQQSVEDTFHLAIVSSLGNELVDASYRRLQLMGRIIRGKAVFFPKVAQVSIQEHLKVISACEQRDSDAAEAEIAAHLSNALNRNLGF